MYTTLENHEEDRFVPALVLGILGGVFSLIYMYEAFFNPSVSFPAISIAVRLLRFSFPAVVIWMGFQGRNAINNKTPFYILLSFEVIYATGCASAMAECFRLLLAEKTYMSFTSAALLVGIISDGSSVLSALSVLFFVLKNRRGCRVSAILAIVSFCVCTLPYAYLYATLFSSESGAFNIIAYATTVWNLFIAGAGDILGTWAFYLYAGKYMPSNGLSDDGIYQPSDQREYAYTSIPDYTLKEDSSAGDASFSQSQEDSSKSKKTKLIFIGTVAAAALCLFSYVGQGFFPDIMQSNEEPVLDQSDIYWSEYYTSDVPELTVPLTQQSEREIHFAQKDVTVRFLGAGVDSEGRLCIIADLINDSNAAVQVSNLIDFRVNNYPIDEYYLVTVKARETLHIKLPIDSMVLETARIDINNISSAFMPMGLAYGKNFDLFDMVDYKCTLEFDAPKKYDLDTEENKTKADSELCYTDENIDVYYQGLITDDTGSYLAFFMQCKNPDLMYIYADKVVPSSNDYTFHEFVSFEEESPSVYLCGGVDISDGSPESFECTFVYSIFQYKGDVIDQTISFSVDPAKLLGK